LSKSRSASQPALAGFLAMGFFPSGVSPFVDISKLPKGLIQTWTQNNGHWKNRNQVITLKTWSTLVISEALSNSVAAHLVSDVPVGVLMSGGVDSTLLAAVVAQHDRDLRTYSLTNKAEPVLDESQFARWNAKLIGSKHTEVEFDVSNSIQIINKIVRSSGEPFGDPAFVPLAVLCERVAQELKVVLAGEGADELFAGYKRYDIERLRDSIYTKYPLRILSKLMKGNASYEKSRVSHKSRSLAAWSEKNPFLSHSFLLFSEWKSVSQLMPEATIQALNLQMSNWEKDFTENNEFKLAENRMFDLNQWLPNVFLEKSDRASMLSGVEIRVPYLDPEVAKSSMMSSPKNSQKITLRRELFRLMPEVKLPVNKMGLGVNTLKLMANRELKCSKDFILHDSHSPLKFTSKKDIPILEQRAKMNPNFGFRISILGIWAQQWLK
jgi:asparagine synthase (glutamine-hydrolysing)